MASSNRAASLVKAHKQLKKLYKPMSSAADRPLLEQLLFACCLENAPYDKAEIAFAAITESYFDLNEVRVSGVSELADTMKCLPDAKAAAANLKQLLQSVFESIYSFDIEAFKKLNLGVAVKRLQQWKGASQFVVSYAVQASLGGHSIPLDRGALDVLYILGVIDEKESQEGVVRGLERAIPKNKGIEFGSLLHQLGAELMGSPYSPATRKLLLDLAPDAKDRLPKRRTKQTVASKATVTEKKAAPAKSKPEAAPKKKPVVVKAKASKKAAPAKKTTAAKKKPATTTKKKAVAPKKQTTKAKKKSASKRLAKKKPR
jgi:hypothetical protein